MPISANLVFVERPVIGALNHVRLDQSGTHMVRAVAATLVAFSAKTLATKIAVSAYMGPHPGVLDWNGQPMDWAWVLRQWDRIAAAKKAVRVVVVDDSYNGLTGTQLNEIAGKLNACHRAGQLVCGYVFGSGGAIPLGPTGSWWTVPRGPSGPYETLSTE